MSSPTIALAGAVDGQLLRAAGWQVRGSLALTPYGHPADPADLPSYPDLDALLDDPGLDGVALDAGDPLLARHLPVLLAGGLHVLLTGPAPLEPDLLRAARAVTGPGPARTDDPGRPARAGLQPAEVVVGLQQRWEPWALTVAAALPLVGTPVVQATVRGWPRGGAAAAELVDLARSWCGEVVAAVAAPAPLPAATLGDGLPVAWTLLHEAGATTLVSHQGFPPLARLSFATARLEAGPLGARWVDGAELRLREPADGRQHPRSTQEELAVRPPAPPSASYGLFGCAVALAEAVPHELVTHRWPWPADLGDLQAVGRVLEALRTSARTQAPCRVG